MHPPPDPAPSTDLHALEQAAFAAWPALEETSVDGWRLRFAQGYTKRANSANAERHQDALSPERRATIEQAFRRRGLTPVFRLASFCTSAALDRQLADAGYRFVDRTWVMARPLTPREDAEPTFSGGADKHPAIATLGSLTLAPDAATWLAVYNAATGAAPSDARLHLQLLQAIRYPCAWGVSGSQRPEACGLGVLVGEVLGLFDIATHASARRQGRARQLCQGLLEWGLARGARQAFLQVVASNEAAMALYQDLGFQTAYSYGYRVAP